MWWMTGRAAGAIGGAVLAAMPAGAGVQTATLPTATPAPTPAPTATASPTTGRLQGLDDFSLPSPRSGPTTVELPTPVPTPRATPRPQPSASLTPRPEPSRRPSPVAMPSPIATPTPVAKPSPKETSPAGETIRPVQERVPVAPPASPVHADPSASPAAPVEPPARPAPAASAVPPSDAGGSSGGLWWIAGALAVVLLAGWAWTRRRREATADPAPAKPAIVPPPPPPPVPRARLEIELAPRRGGLTLISLVFEGELLVRNTGDAPAAQVTVEASLIPARSGQDEELGVLFARPIARPAAAPFALAPGEERRVRLVAALPLAGVEPLVAGGRSMLVPVLAANTVYASGAGEGQTAASWIVGIARPGSDKLAPFWIDAPGLSDTLATRPHALAVVR